MPLNLIHRLYSLLSKNEKEEVGADFDEINEYELSNLTTKHMNRDHVGIIGRENENILRILKDTMVPEATRSGKCLVIASEDMARGIYNSLKPRRGEGGIPHPESVDQLFLFNPADGLPAQVSEIIGRDQKMSLPKGHFVLYYPEKFLESGDSEAINQWLKVLTTFMNAYLSDRHESGSAVAFDIKPNKEAPRVPFYLGGLEAFTGPLFNQLSIHALHAGAFRVQLFAGVRSIAEDRLLARTMPMLGDLPLLLFPDKDRACRDAQMYTLCEYIYRQEAALNPAAKRMALPVIDNMGSRMKMPAIVRWPGAHYYPATSREVIRVW